MKILVFLMLGFYSLLAVDFVKESDYKQLPNVNNIYSLYSLEKVSKCPDRKVINKRSHFTNSEKIKKDKIYKLKDGYQVIIAVCSDEQNRIDILTKVVKYDFEDPIIESK